jgi:hypothetical protein
MLLADWEIKLRRDPEPVGGASVVLIPGRRSARIRLNGRFGSYTRAVQRHSIVHELVHCHLSPLGYHMGRQLHDHPDEEQMRVRWKLGHSSHEEYAVDQLARIIAPRMPLPPKVKSCQ